MTLRSSLSRRVQSGPTHDEALEAMRRAAYRKQGVITIRPEEVPNEWARQWLRNWAEERWGPAER